MKFLDIHFLAVCIGAGIATTAPASAADYAVKARPSVANAERSPYCGERCGCPQYSLDKHRRIVQYYPASFDPRERDEPLYRYGALRTYAHYYWVPPQDCVRP